VDRLAQALVLLGEDEVRAPRAVVGLEDGLGGAHGGDASASPGWRAALSRARVLTLAGGCGEGVGPRAQGHRALRVTNRQIESDPRTVARALAAALSARAA
jgi:hypothetical protein